MRFGRDSLIGWLSGWWQSSSREGNHIFFFFWDTLWLRYVRCGLVLISLAVCDVYCVQRTRTSSESPAAAADLHFRVLLLIGFFAVTHRWASSSQRWGNRRHRAAHICMLTFAMAPQVDLSLERLIAHAALEWLITRMFSHVRNEVGALAERLLANYADVWFLTWKEKRLTLLIYIKWENAKSI